MEKIQVDDIAVARSVQAAGVPPIGVEQLRPSEDGSYRMTIEANAPEEIGVVPVFGDVLSVIGILCVFVVINAVWSAAEDSMLGIIRRAWRGRRIDGLFLGIDLRPIQPGAARRESSAPGKPPAAGPQHAFLTSIHGRTAEVYANEPLTVGDVVAVISEVYGKLQARVRVCRLVHDEKDWYRVKLKILEGKDHEARRFVSFLSTAAAPSALAAWLLGSLALCSLTVAQSARAEAGPAAASTTATGAAIATDASAARDTTQGIMATLLEPMTRALEVSFDRAEFASAKNRPLVETQLARLVEGAARLEQHGRTREGDFELVARSLARDVRETLRLYKRGDYEESRRTLHNLTDNCIACHASLPEGRQIPSPERFFATLRSKDLSPLALAHFQIVSRQFDAAMTTMEGIFTAEGVETSLAPLLSYLGDYLKIAIGIKNDFQRPAKLLGTLLGRPATPVHLRRLLESWTMALTEVEAAKPFATPTLTTARRLMEQGRARMDAATDRAGLVQYLTAESILQRVVRARDGKPAASGGATQAPKPVEIAEAYYLLGNATSLSEHSQWITRTDFCYETAVRMAPQTPFALKAYGALEERLHAAAKLDGLPLDADSEFLLDELYQLIEEAQGRRQM